MQTLWRSLLLLLLLRVIRLRVSLPQCQQMATMLQLELMHSPRTRIAAAWRALSMKLTRFGPFLALSMFTDGAFYAHSKCCQVGFRHAMHCRVALRLAVLTAVACSCLPSMSETCACSRGNAAVVRHQLGTHSESRAARTFLALSVSMHRVAWHQVARVASSAAVRAGCSRVRAVDFTKHAACRPHTAQYTNIAGPGRAPLCDARTAPPTLYLHAACIARHSMQAAEIASPAHRLAELLATVTEQTCNAPGTEASPATNGVRHGRRCGCRH